LSSPRNRKAERRDDYKKLFAFLLNARPNSRLLKQQLQSELDLPRGGGSIGDHPRGGRWRGGRRDEHHGIGASEVGPVQKIEEFRAEAS